MGFSESKGVDAIVVGAGPNGLAAAIVLAEAGLEVLVLEANATIGGGCRTAELTLPGFHHDICAAIHPMGVASPFLSQLPLTRYGLEWVNCPLPLAHPLPDGEAAILTRSVEETAGGLGRDREAWRRLFAPFVQRADILLPELLKPIRFPQHPWLMARFGLLGLRSCEGLVRRFESAEAQALFAGCAAHSFLPLNAAASASFGLVLAMVGHALDWPCARGGSENIVRAMAKHLETLGGRIQTGRRVQSLRELPASRAVLFDVTPRQLAGIAGAELPAGYVTRLRRYRYGPGVFKVDWAMRGPIPWKNPACARAGTVHVGGTFQEIAASEASAWNGQATDKPFVLVAQQSMFDATRAPRGQHTGWAYCHVPQGCPIDFTERIEQQIERFAPGFRDCILARHVMRPADFEAHNANMIGGDIAGGANTLMQFLFRPFPRWNPYTTPNPRLFLCSSSTPPGGGVHGMCGYWAARAVLRNVFGSEVRN
jgi:phytoene dehydrogenase-like protein